MSNRKLPETSIEAFQSLQDSEVKKTYLDIIWALSVIKQGTYEDISRFLKCKPDKIWKRLNEIGGKKYNLIHRPGEKRALKSGRKGYVWALNQDTPVPTKTIPGKSIADFSRAINQVKPSSNTIERLF